MKTHIKYSRIISGVTHAEFVKKKKKKKKDLADQRTWRLNCKQIIRSVIIRITVRDPYAGGEISVC